MWPLFENEIYCALYPVFTGQLQNLWNIDVDVDRNIEAPIEAGQKLGKITYKSNDIIIGESNLIARNKIKKQNIFLIFLSFIVKIILIFIGLMILLIFFNYFRIRYYYYQKKKRNEKERF